MRHIHGLEEGKLAYANLQLAKSRSLFKIADKVEFRVS